PGIRLLGISDLADGPRTGFGDHGVADGQVFRKYKFHHVAFFGGPGVYGFGELQGHFCALPQDQLRIRRWRSAAFRAAWIACLLGTSRRQKQASRREQHGRNHDSHSYLHDYFWSVGACWEDSLAATISGRPGCPSLLSSS